MGAAGLHKKAGGNSAVLTPEITGIKFTSLALIRGTVITKIHGFPAAVSTLISTLLMMQHLQ